MEEAGRHDELLTRAGAGARRALGELDRAAQDLALPWPRVAPDVLAEGRSAVERVAAALRALNQRLDAGPSSPDPDP